MNNNYLKAGFHHCDPQLPQPGASGLSRLPAQDWHHGNPWEAEANGSSEIIHRVSVSDTASGLNDGMHQQEGEE